MDKPRQQRRQLCRRGRLAKSIQNAVDGQPRRNLALRVSAYAICQGKEPPSGAHLRGCSRRIVTEAILISFTDQSWIGYLGEFEVQHKLQALLYLSYVDIVQAVPVRVSINIFRPVFLLPRKKKTPPYKPHTMAMPRANNGSRVVP
jgi:hypothetical protein